MWWGYFGVSDVVNKNTAISSSVESESQRLESLLASGIPQLQVVDGVVHSQLLRNEVSPDGRLVLVVEFASHESGKQRGLSDAALINQEEPHSPKHTRKWLHTQSHQ